MEVSSGVVHVCMVLCVLCDPVHVQWMWICCLMMERNTLLQ